MSGKWFVTDLDGTLLRSDASVSDFTVSVWEEAAKQGCTIGYATARSIVSSGKIVSRIPWNSPLIVYNGARIVDPVTGAELGGHMLKPSITNEVIELGKTFELCPFLFLLDENRDEKVFHERLHREGERKFHASRPGDPRFRLMDRLSCPGDASGLTITYIGLHDELAPFHQEAVRQFGSHIHVHFMADNYIQNHYFLEFSHPKANKKQGLLKWCELTGADPGDVTVFGDQVNDIGMFEAAGTKLAVANAHEDLKALASSVIGSNDGDGVAVYLKQRLSESD